MNTLSPKAAVVAAAAILLVSACGQSAVSTEPITATPPPAPTSAAGPPKPPAAPTATVTINNFEFSDATVAPGGQITVQNLDRDAHTVTSNTPGLFNVDIAASSKAVFTAPTKPGSYPFHCEHHASMHGVLTVQ